MLMRSQPYSLSVQLRLAAMRHGRGGHSSETAAARERKEAVQGLKAARQLDESERHGQRPAVSQQRKISRGTQFTHFPARDGPGSHVRAYLSSTQACSPASEATSSD